MPSDTRSIEVENTMTPSCPSTPTKARPITEEEQVSPCKTFVSSNLTTADDWYLQGERVLYDPVEKLIVEEDDEGVEGRVKVFHRVVLPQTPTTPQRWMTFLPSNPEGSFGFSSVEEALSCASNHGKNRCDTEDTDLSTESVTETMMDEDVCQQNLLARLYLDYQGQGDSDSSNEDSSPTKQRADLVEALWRKHSIERTVVVSAGDSSLVVMELLQRQRQRLAAGSPFPKILHVLSLNGRYVAKTRHTSQLATVTQLLRSDRVGPSLAHKAQRSEFTLSQCLQPYLKGSTRHTRKQVAQIVRRNEGAASLVDMARTVDDHLDDKHRYRWHLPHLFKVFTRDQGITFHLVTNHRSGLRQVRLVQQEDYMGEDSPGIRYTDYSGASHMATSSFLLDSSPAQFQAFVKDIQRLGNQEIPLSDNSLLRGITRSSLDEVPAEEDATEGEDSWHPNEEEDLSLDPSLDTRLDREIVFDASEMDDEELDFFF